MESGCDDDSPECWCPCNCGCQNDAHGSSLPFTDKIGGIIIIPIGHIGMCHDCARGVHEVVPEFVRKMDDVIAAHQDILAFLQRLKSSKEDK